MMQLSLGAPGWQTEHKSINQFDLVPKKDSLHRKEEK
jgi:hypothetical protein